MKSCRTSKGRICALIVDVTTLFKSSNFTAAGLKDPVKTVQPIELILARAKAKSQRRASNAAKRNE